jgi:hypothetical protein
MNQILFHFSQSILFNKKKEEKKKLKIFNLNESLRDLEKK